MRVGRGIGSGKGKTGGRGVKGQKIPYRRVDPASKADGDTLCIAVCRSAASTSRTQSTSTRSMSAVSSRPSKPGKLDRRDRRVAGSAAGVVSKPRDGVKILGVGELKTKLSFQVHGASKSAVEAIEKAGGLVTLLGAVAQA